jgi:predicted nicotinamide N-methyase
LSNAHIDSTHSLDQLLDKAREKYQVHFEPVAAGDVTLSILQISNMQDYLEKLATLSPKDREDGGKGIEALPLWSKIWPSSLITAHFLASGAHPETKTVLEIGAGVGVTGLFAAAFGYKVTVSDINPEALLFARINALKNGLADSLAVEKIDFSNDDLGKRFDTIIGSEVLYNPDLHRPLLKFLLKHIKRSPEAEVILARDFSRNPGRFFKMAEDEFHMAQKNIGVKSTDEGGNAERRLCTIHRLRPRKHA